MLKRHRKARDKRVCDRIKAVLAYDEGYSYSEIARILLLDDETIRRHVEDYLGKKNCNLVMVEVKANYQKKTVKN